MITRESSDKALNDMVYRRMREQLEEKFQGKYAVIAEGELLGAEDSLEKAWALASPYESAVVTMMTKKPLRARILGSSLRM